MLQDNTPPGRRQGHTRRRRANPAPHRRDTVGSVSRLDPRQVLVLACLTLADCRADREHPGARLPEPTATASSPPAASPATTTAIAMTPPPSPPSVCPDGEAVNSPRFSCVFGSLEPDPELVRRACVHCTYAQFPADWLDIVFEFPLKSITWSSSPAVEAMEARLVALLQGNAELALGLEGRRSKQEPPTLARRRAEALARRLQSLGVAPRQLVISDHGPHPTDNGAVMITRARARPEPVHPNEPCGTRVVTASGRHTLWKDLKAQGWWLYEEQQIYRDRRPAPSRAPLVPLHGSRLGAVVDHTDGFTTLRSPGSSDRFTLLHLGAEGAVQHEHPVTIDAPGWARVRLAQVPGGFLVAWHAADGQLCTTVLDATGAAKRASRCVKLETGPIEEMAMDWREGIGGIVYSVAGRALIYNHTEFVPIDSDGLPQGPTRTLALDSGSSVAVIVTGPDRLSVLADGCGPFAARLDIDPRGEVLGFDRRFIRNGGQSGVAVARDKTGAWAVSLTDDRADIRPLCPLTRPAAPG